MAFKSYKHGLKRIEDQGYEFCRVRSVFPKTNKFLNPWWNRQRHPGWAAYHAHKDKK